MFNIRRLLLIFFAAIFIVGCGKTTLTPEATLGNQSLVSTAVKLDITSVPTESGSYPAPQNPGGEVQGELVPRLEIPTPSSGKSVVSGQLSETGNDIFYITKLYLSPISQSGSGESQPSVNFSEETDPIATVESGTGRFMFVDVEPGTYALVIWTAMQAYPIEDAQGNTIVFSVNPNEKKDLGVIVVK